MATQYLPVAVGAASSADVVVSSPISVCLKGAKRSLGIVIIEIKDDAGAYWPIGELRGGDSAKVLQGAGTYRFSRTADSAECGVFGA